MNKSVKKHKSLEEKVLEKLKESGYPLEFYVTEILEKEGWTVLNQVPYRDSDEDKTRDLDILATCNYQISEPSVYKKLSCWLLIECKSLGDKPWVFYMRKKKSLAVFSDKLIQILALLRTKGILSNNDESKIFDYIASGNCSHHYYSMYNVGLIAENPLSKGKDRIFEAKNQIVKALNYYDEDLDHKTSLKSGIIFLIYPLIIIDGNLFEFYGGDSIEKSEYIQYFVRYIKKTYEERLIIEVLSKDYLKEYLDEINIENQNIKNFIECNIVKP